MRLPMRVAPIDPLPLDRKVIQLLHAVQHANRLIDHFRPNAVTGIKGNSKRLHVTPRLLCAFLCPATVEAGRLFRKLEKPGFDRSASCSKTLGAGMTLLDVATPP